MTATLSKYAEIWENAKICLRERLPAAIFEEWFKNIHFLDFSDGTFKLGAKDYMVSIFIKDTYADVMDEAFFQASGQPCRYEICKVDVTPASVPAQAPDLLPGISGSIVMPEAPAAKLPAATPPNASVPAEALSPLISRQNTFSNFIVGSENDLALAAAQSLANNIFDPDAANPLFIYGPSGVGKTHLMHAIANAVFDKNPNARICYTTCEMFTNDYTYSLSQNAIHDFRRRYRDLNLLLMDDIQFLAGKKGMQEEFFHTFNQLVVNGCKIVLVSDRSATDIQIEDRLISRFQQGISADIQPPCLEMRMAILSRKAQAKNFDFSRYPGVREFVAQRITRNVRNLEGAVNTLVGYVKIRTGTQLTLPEVENILGNLLRQEEASKITPEYIQYVVAEAYGINVDKMTEKGRGSANIAFARQVAMYLCREEIKGMASTAIGNAFGNRDHATVLYALKTVKNRIETNADDKRKVEQIREKLNQGTR